MKLLEPTLAVDIRAIEASAACAFCGGTRHRTLINKVAFDVIDADGLSESVAKFIRCGASHVMHFLPVHPTVAAREVPEYADLLNAGDLIVADGAPIAVTMRLRGLSGERITGTDGFQRVCADGLAKGLRHYFVGGSSEHVGERFCDELRRRHPQIEIAGLEVPPFRPYSDSEVGTLARTIRSSSADIVWIGLGVPKQDLLAHRLKAANAAPVIAGIGAVFDFVAGTKRRAPWIVRTLGLEWGFRLASEPRRLGRRYVVGNTRFVKGVCSDAIHGVFESEKSKRGST